MNSLSEIKSSSACIGSNSITQYGMGLLNFVSIALKKNNGNKCEVIMKSAVYIP